MTSFEPRVTRRPVRRLTSVQIALAVRLTAALLLVGDGSAHAEQLRYRAPATCPPANRFENEVAARLGFSPWRGSEPLEVQFTAQADSVTVALRTTQTHKTLRAATCALAFELAVAASAVLLDTQQPAVRATQPSHTRPPALHAQRSPSRLQRTYSDAHVARQRHHQGKRIAPGLSETLDTWAFADRNNLFQLGGVAGTSGFGLVGNVPLGRGHLVGTLGFVDVVTNLAAGYAYPVFYINRNSLFEVPIYVEGGAQWQRVDYDQTQTSIADQSSVFPYAAVSHGIQFRGFPIEVHTKLGAAIGQPLLGTRFMFDFSLRYVWGR